MKNVLMIVYHFPPIGGSGVQRSLKYVKYLRKHGYEPIVATVDQGHNFAYDYKMLEEIPEGIKVYRSNSGETLWLRKIIETVFGFISRVKSSFRRSQSAETSESTDAQTTAAKSETIKDKIFRWMEYNYYIPDTKVRWYKHAVKNIKNEILKENNIDFIYSTSSPYTDHLIALEIKKATGLPWVADFRDPWVGNVFITEHHPESRKEKERIMEREVIRLADKVVMVTEPICETYMKRYPEYSDKFATITNGFDSADFMDLEVKGNHKFTINYSGILVKGQDPSGLIEALEILSKEDEGFSRDFQMVFRGALYGEYEHMLKNCSLKDKIHIKEYIPHNEIVKEMKSASMNLLMLPDIEASNGIFSGKIFDYIGAERPILAILPKEGIAAKLINERNIGGAFGFGEIQTMKDYIAETYVRWKAGESLSTGAVEKCREYDRINLAGNLAGLFNELSV